MRGALLLVLLMAAPAPKAPKGKRAPDAGVDAPVAAPALVPKAHAAVGDTACAACHVPAGWTDVRFNHDRTGFPLTGAHAATACKACHASAKNGTGADFEKALPTTCAGCHRDVHGADLGARCEGCHDTASWASRFDADAHRRTGFPLIGAHAALPCTECHADAVGRRFSRPALECPACHQADLARTRGTALDHLTLGFTGNCRQCHQPYRFRPARFPEHDRCYLISAGAHAGIACSGCHDGFPAAAAPPGTCATRTPACTKCHTCTGPTGSQPTDQLHQPPKTAAPVPGYACADRRCYQCHKQVGNAP